MNEKQEATNELMQMLINIARHAYKVGMDAIALGQGLGFNSTQEDMAAMIESFKEFDGMPFPAPVPSPPDRAKILWDKFVAQQKDRETLRDTLRELKSRIGIWAPERTTSHVEGMVQLIDQALSSVPIGEYILREEHEARMKGQDAAFRAALAVKAHSRIIILND